MKAIVCRTCGNQIPSLDSGENVACPNCGHVTTGAQLPGEAELPLNTSTPELFGVAYRAECQVFSHKDGWQDHDFVFVLKDGWVHKEATQTVRSADRVRRIIEEGKKKGS